MDTIPVNEGMVHCSPREAGYREENLDRLDEHFKGLIEDEEILCASLLLARKGRIFAHRYWGKQTPEKDSPDYGPTSIRKLASVTKIFTAAAIMKLVEQGKLFLYQSISSLIPEFDTDLHRKVNLVHLLTHTSGVVRPDGGSSLEPYPDWGFWGLREEDGKHKWMKSALSGPMLREPGTEWMYCSAGMMILADVVSRASGMAYHEFVRQEFLEPLKMEDSYYFITQEHVPRLCLPEGEKPRGLEEPYPAEYSFVLGSNGLQSSTMDLWRFGQMLLNGGELDGVRVLGPRTVEIFTKNHLKGVSSRAWGNILEDKPYGLGVDMYDQGLVSPGTFGHEGAGRCRIMLDPAEELAAVYFIPSHKDWSPRSVVDTVPMIWSGLV